MDRFILRFYLAEYAENWDRLDQNRALALIRKIHETTTYDDNAAPVF
jgi:hypothetical protein